MKFISKILSVILYLTVCTLLCMTFPVAHAEEMVQDDVEVYEDFEYEKDNPFLRNWALKLPGDITALLTVYEERGRVKGEIRMGTRPDHDFAYPVRIEFVQEIPSPEFQVTAL